MSLKNTICKICGYKFHECGSCDHTGVPWLAEGCCCVDCWQEYMDGRIEALSNDNEQLRSLLCQAVESEKRYWGDCIKRWPDMVADFEPWYEEAAKKVNYE